MKKTKAVYMDTNMDKFPKYLYYYTTMETLKKIVENQTLWLGDYRFMNDEEELTWSAKTIRKAFSRPDYQKDDGYDYKGSIDKIKEIIKDIIVGNLHYATNRLDPVSNERYACRKIANRTSRYIFCLSSNENDKDMWAQYGNGERGCRIKFDITELNNYFMQVKQFNGKHYNPFFLCTKVNYNASDLIEQATTIRNRFWVGPEEPLTAENAVFCILISHKNNNFANENEYRIVCAYSDDSELYSRANNNSLSIKKVYQNFGTYIKPFIEINNLPIEKVISEIMISPFNKSDLSMIGVEDLLYHNTKKKIKVVKSKISIR